VIRAAAYGVAMPEQVRVPRLGEEMTSGVLIRWLAEDGAEVAPGDPLYELDTDKVTQEVEAEAAGTLRILADPGREYPVGETIALIDG
jgi:pyruvate/2-oxoglutarate dehydrogenase complex dihydrolipoamide acyltransferase (E2) component